MEHSPVTLETLRNMVLATRGMPALPFARVPVNEIWTAKRVLDTGVRGVIFPFTSTPELAAPGRRGLPLSTARTPRIGRRAGQASPGPNADDYTDSADQNVTVIIIIEEARAVEHIDEIAATPGIDALFIGTSDLSFSLGLRGDQKDPRLQQAVAKVVEAGKRHGKAVGRPARTPEQVKQYIEQGFQLFQAPTDLGFLTAGAKRYLEAL